MYTPIAIIITVILAMMSITNILITNIAEGKTRSTLMPYSVLSVIGDGAAIVLIWRLILA